MALTKFATLRGIPAVCISEVIRTSSFYNSGDSIGSWAEVHAFARQVVEEIEQSRDHELLVCDRTVISALAYWRIRVPKPSFSEEQL